MWKEEKWPLIFSFGVLLVTSSVGIAPWQENISKLGVSKTI
jgi:hypothetical protein